MKTITSIKLIAIFCLSSALFSSSSCNENELSADHQQLLCEPSTDLDMINYPELEGTWIAQIIDSHTGNSWDVESSEVWVEDVIKVVINDQSVYKIEFRNYLPVENEVHKQNKRFEYYNCQGGPIAPFEITDDMSFQEVYDDF